MQNVAISEQATTLTALKNPSDVSVHLKIGQLSRFLEKKVDNLIRNLRWIAERGKILT